MTALYSNSRLVALASDRQVRTAKPPDPTPEIVHLEVQ